jgi:hypothetical protein
MGVTRSTRRAVGIAPLVLLSLVGCTTIDPGSNYVVSTVTFDSNYFYCFVEPQFIFAYNCGPGDPSLDPPNGCHFNPSAVSGMGLQNHAPVNCGGGDQVVDLTQIGTGSPAQSNLEAVSAEMSQQYMTAPLFVRPTGNNHPRQVFKPSDPVVNQLLSTWASK